jgi:hypothetical protein
MERRGDGGWLGRGDGTPLINNGEEKTSVVRWLFGFFMVKKIIREA